MSRPTYDELATMLRELEWIGSAYDTGGPACPRCDEFKGTSHWHGCDLGALLARLDAPVTPVGETFDRDRACEAERQLRLALSAELEKVTAERDAAITRANKALILCAEWEAAVRAPSGLLDRETR
jgi:hypothetical protein